MTVLLLGGTAEGHLLADLLTDEGVDVESSLAGRVEKPRLPGGRVRIGGFGGVDGLVAYLVVHSVSAVVDATHPFAMGMSANAVQACTTAGVPLLRLERPGWEDAPGSGEWIWVDGHRAAAERAAELGRAPFLTVGRQELGAFLAPLADHRALVRVVDAPSHPLPGPWTLVTSRGPYSEDGERTLMTSHGADVLVTKDSGGSYTWPKMAVAAQLGIPVVIVKRGTVPGNVVTVSDAEAAAAWVREQH